MSSEIQLNSPRRPVRLFISTGEVSGDLQGSLLIEALQQQAKELDLDLEILALGGDRMAAAGATLLGHTSTTGSIGLLEALPFVLPTLRIQQRAKQYLRDNPPDLVILIDYMGPNVTIGSYLREHLPKVPIVYYIAPQEWVLSLGPKQTANIVQISDLLLAVFPEEARYYREKGARVQWVGHPLIDRLKTVPDRLTARRLLGLSETQPVVSLLPVSRTQELKYLIPIVFTAACQIQEKLPDVQFLLPLSLSNYRQPLEAAIQKYGLNARLLINSQIQELRQTAPELPEGISISHLALAASDLAIAKSGTVNLETALLNVPQVVLYRFSGLTYWIAENILKLKVPFVSPPNLVLMRSLVPEFIQAEATVENVLRASLELLLDQNCRKQMLQGYEEMRQALGEPGVCDRAAKEIFGLLLPNSSGTKSA